MLVLMPIAGAQETTMMMQETMMGGGAQGATMMEETMMAGGQAGAIPESGGPAILLPAAALLLGSGILTYAILRRR
jgi:hypothetical protein